MYEIIFFLKGRYTYVTHTHTHIYTSVQLVHKYIRILRNVLSIGVFKENKSEKPNIIP